MVTLITGAAGFIGFHLAKRLLDDGCEVHAVDNVNAYYDVRLKEARLALLQGRPGFHFQRLDLADREATAACFRKIKPQRVIHLAAQAGVRYSLENPHAYADSNLVGFLNVLEGCRHNSVAHLVYASSSSVYGANTKIPFSTTDNVDHPVSFYAATKKANELMAHTYSHLFRLPTTGLRFFTVYGPWGRPDMAYYSFTKAIFAGAEIPVFNHGKMRRDFTHVDDIIEGLVRVANLPPASPARDGKPTAPYRIYNIGNNQPVDLLEFIRVLERHIGRAARLKLLPMQPGDVLETYADIADLTRDTGFKPSTTIEQGLGAFVDWYRQYTPSAL